ncbi:MAG: peptidoglycan D,D-transpeptidase FtsI family protein [Planctomycetota bacterium]|jgi:penicillin-binding protein 2
MFKRRVRILISLFCVIFIVLLYRLFSLQFIHSKSLKARQQNRLHRLEQIAPRRGSILDRNGVVLAEDTSSFDLWLYPARWNEHKGQTVKRLFGFLPAARIEPLLESSGAHLAFEQKLVLEFIEKKSPFAADLSRITGIDIRNVAEKILLTAKRSLSDKSPGTLFFPRKFFTNINQKAYIKVLSDNSLFGENSKYRYLEPKTGWRRKYPFGEEFAHIIGYVSPLNNREYERLRGKWGNKGMIEGQGYIENFFIPTETEKYIMRLYEYNRSGKIYRASGHLANNLAGRTGIEQEYNNILRGTHGLRHLRLSRPKRGGPRVLQVSGVDAEVQAGQNIRITINSKVQRQVFSIMQRSLEKLSRERNEKFTGACILMNPNNGEVEAMVSLPSYDPYLVSRKYREYTSPKSMRPFLNRTISEIYPPGSTFKPVVALAALSHKLITKETELTCDGFINLGGHDFICMRKYSHGPIDVHHAIRLSCNVFFYKAGKNIGHRKIFNLATDLGFGRKTGIDLPSEAAGIIPEGAKTGRRWSTGNTFHMSIGQGVAFTPLQMAVAVSAIANGGKVVKPHLLHFENNQENKLNNPKSNLNIPKESLEVVRQAMWAVVNENGTGKKCHLKAMAVSGKSGSADWKRGEPTHAWFTAYAPSENPQLVVVIIVPRGDFGGKTCAPIAREIIKMYFNLPDSNDAVG